jgi:urease accessory protein
MHPVHDSSLHIVRGPLPVADDGALEEIPVTVERRSLARRIWRGLAADGTEFGFELAAPLRHGDCVRRTATHRYVVRQTSEPVLEIPLDFSPDEAAVVGWLIGNMHCPIERRKDRLLVADEGLIRQVLERAGIRFTASRGVFRPGGFAGGTSTPAHSHAAMPVELRQAFAAPAQPGAAAILAPAMRVTLSPLNHVTA